MSLDNYLISESKMLISRIEKILGQRSTALIVGSSSRDARIKITRNSDHYLIVKTDNQSKRSFYKDIIRIDFDGNIESVVSQALIPCRLTSKATRKGFMANDNVLDKLIVAPTAKHAIAEGIVAVAEASVS